MAAASEREQRFWRLGKPVKLRGYDERGADRHPDRRTLTGRVEVHQSDDDAQVSATRGVGPSVQSRAASTASSSAEDDVVEPAPWPDHGGVGIDPGPSFPASRSVVLIPASSTDR